jgi:membrane protein DedA with SNARE-associated domain
VNTFLSLGPPGWSSYPGLWDVARPSALGYVRQREGRAGAPGPSSAPGGPDRGIAGSKYWHYAFVTALLVMSVCILALANAYLRIDNQASYAADVTGVPSSILLAGYLGMFFSVLVLPIPDYILVPVYGSLSSVGIFNPVATFLVCLAASVFPVEYACGRLLARPVVSRILPLFMMSERELQVADRWVDEHGRFSVFISTFIPFFYSAVCLVAGTLRMAAVPFLLSCAVGFGLRYAVLEYAGYYAVYIFTASFDYSLRLPTGILLASSCAFVALYLLERAGGLGLWSRR